MAELLPLREYIMKFSKYLSEEGSKLLAIFVNGEGGPSEWTPLNEIALGHMIVFNRRRPGVVSKMTVQAFKGRKTPSADDILIDGWLTPFEKELCRRFSRIEILGWKSASASQPNVHGVDFQTSGGHLPISMLQRIILPFRWVLSRMKVQ